MSEVIRQRLNESVGGYAKIFLKNGFKFEGKITNLDDKYIELLEPRGYKILLLEEISDAEIKNEVNEDEGKI